MIDKPLVSIITPCYNHAEFIEDTICSVLHQDYPNIEYIIIDGGSTDGSVEIIRKYDSRISKWVSQPDDGQSDAINKGFRIASGDIVAWLNADDMYFPNAVSNAVARFKSQPDLDLFYGDCVFVGREGGFLRYFTEVEPYDKFRLLNCSDFIMQPTVFMRRDRLMEMGLLDASLHWTMDWELWCRFACEGCRFHYEPHLIAANRVYEQTKTSVGGHARLREIKKMTSRYKTTRWPHAYYSYWGGHIAESIGANNPKATQIERLFYLPIMKFIALPAWKNYRHSRKNKDANTLYGFFPHSLACQQTAQLCILTPSPIQKAKLIIHTPKQILKHEPKVDISVNGKLAKQVGWSAKTGCRKTLLFDVAECAAEDHKLDLRLNFSHAHRKVGGAIEEFSLIK